MSRRELAAMPGLTLYAQQMLNIHTKYGLSSNAKTLLRAMDDYNFGRIDQKELGRIVRLSSSMRKAITDTIKKCAEIMSTKPGEVKHCVDIIQSCTDILAIADQPSPIEEFPLMKLPAEIRQKIFEQYLRIGSRERQRVIMAYPKKSACDCFGHEPVAHATFQVLNMALAQVSRQVRDEFLSFLYKRCTFHFACSCDMLENLQGNKMLKAQIQGVRVHWVGPVSNAAFVCLSKCPKLESLGITISKSTTKFLTARETELGPYFAQAKSNRLLDARGMDELLQIRGLRQVVVTHIMARQGLRRSDEERAHLQALLQAKLTQPVNW